MAGKVYFTPEHMSLKFDPAGDANNPFYTDQEHRFANGSFRLFVPRGFRTDLASIPRMPIYLLTWTLICGVAALLGDRLAFELGSVLITFLGWLLNPFDSYQRAALFHDAAYRLQPDDMTRYEADSGFRIIMERDGVHWLRVLLLYGAVRLFGQAAWDDNRQKLNEDVRLDGETL